MLLYIYIYIYARVRARFRIYVRGGYGGYSAGVWVRPSAPHPLARRP